MGCKTQKIIKKLWSNDKMRVYMYLKQFITKQILTECKNTFPANTSLNR